MDNYYLGLDIGGTKCAALLARSGGLGDGRIDFLRRDEFPTSKYSCTEMMDNFIFAFKDYLVSCPVRPQALGISCGGPLDLERGIIQSPPNLQGWDDVRIVDILKEKLGVPVFLENDANAGALAEWIYGAGRNKRNLIFLTFGTGMGAGLILDGRLYRGSSNLAGEVGHIRLSDDGPVGYHKEGSFEGFCSGGGIARLGRMMLDGGNEPSTLRGLDELSAKTIALEADKGDSLALKIYRIVGRYLGRGLSVLIDAFNPEMIILGGIYRVSRHLLKAEMRKALEEEALAPILEACEIRASELGSRIGDYAAVSTAIIGAIS